MVDKKSLKVVETLLRTLEAEKIGTHVCLKSKRDSKLRAFIISSKLNIKDIFISLGLSKSQVVNALIGERDILQDVKFKNGGKTFELIYYRL